MRLSGLGVGVEGFGGLGAAGVLQFGLLVWEGIHSAVYMFRKFFEAFLFERGTHIASL